MAAGEPLYSFSTLTLPGLSDLPQPADVNNRGDIVGIYYDAGGQHGFLLHEGQATTIDVPGADSTTAWGINDAGDIVGSYSVQVGNEFLQHGFLYHDGTFATLDIPEARSTELRGINNHGEIVAFVTASGPSLPSGGFLYRDGSFTALTVPDAPDAFLVPEGINDAGVITGVSDSHGFVLDNGRLTLLDYPTATFFTRASDINNEGQVIGEAAPGRGVTVGFLYEDGRFVTLDPPMPPNRAPSTALAGINDAGEIVGNGPVSGSGAAAFLATPAPRPAVDWDALAAEVQANFAATGRWFAGDGAPPPAGTDWDALAAQVTAHFAATGQWFA